MQTGQNNEEKLHEYINKMLSKAIACGQRRNYEQAVKILEPLALEHSIKEPRIMLYLARSYHALQNLSMAVSAFHTYLAICPNDASGWFFLGRTYLTMNLFSKATAAFSKSLEINPHSTEALGLLGMTLLKQKDSSNALKAFEAALNIDPDDERLNNGYRNALMVEAIRTFNKGDVALALRMFLFLTDNGVDTVLVHLYQGHCHRTLRNLDFALEAYRKAIALSPDDTSLKWYEFQILLEKDSQTIEKNQGNPKAIKDYEMDMLNRSVMAGNWNAVIRLGREYIKKYGGDAIVHNSMGEAARNLGKYRAAINHFTKAQRFNPQILASRYGLLMTFLEVENYQAIRLELKKADSALAPLDQDTVEYYSALCDARLDAPGVSTIAKLTQVLQSHPKDTLIMSLLANQYLALSVFEYAEKWYEKLIKLEDNNHEACSNYIICLEALKKWTKALNAYKNYMEKWPKDHRQRIRYIQLLLKKKKYALAADNTEQLLPYVKNPLAIIRDVATYRRKAEQYALAAIHYQTLIQNDPLNPTLIHQFVFCLVKDGKLEQALLVMERFHDLVNPGSEGLLIEASLLYQLGRVEDALDVLRYALGLYPEDRRISEKIAGIYEKSGSKAMSDIFRQ